MKRDMSSAWIGRSLRRVEDATLVSGEGRFTGDLPAAKWVRFVRSQVACGRIRRIGVPSGAMVITAEDLSGVKPICPMLHKFNYVPISQPILAQGVVRFVGEAVAAAVASTREEAEDLADLIESKSTSNAPWSRYAMRSLRAHRSSMLRQVSTPRSRHA